MVRILNIFCFLLLRNLKIVCWMQEETVEPYLGPIEVYPILNWDFVVYLEGEDALTESYTPK